MNQRVDQQMTACVHAKELAINHVRNPSERMPVCRMKRSERPGESTERNTAIYHWIFLNIRGVIESDELMPDHLRVNRERHYGQTEQDQKIGSPEGYGSACVSLPITQDSGSSAIEQYATSFFLLR